jgi:hypothetical protein
MVIEWLEPRETFITLRQIIWLFVSMHSASSRRCRTSKGKGGQRARHHPLHGRECGLDNQTVRDRCHYFLGSDRERRKTPRDYSAECCVLESTR